MRGFVIAGLLWRGAVMRLVYPCNVCNATAAAIWEGRRPARRLCLRVQAFVVLACRGCEVLDDVGIGAIGI